MSNFDESIVHKTMLKYHEPEEWIIEKIRVISFT
jgi:hypothetical protein